MTIKRATTDHLHLIAPLFDAYRQFYGQPSNLEGAATFLGERLKNRDSVLFLATDDSGKAAGFAHLYPSFSSVSMKRLWILNDLFVSKAARGKGIGKALLTKAVELAKETKSKGLVLETQSNNIPAKNLYERSGWSLDRAFDRYFLTLP